MTLDVKVATYLVVSMLLGYPVGDAETIAIAKGGTGQTTKTEAFDALSPTTTQGDIIASNGTDNIRFAMGAAQTVLAVNAGASSLAYERRPLFLRTTGIDTNSTSTFSDIVNLTITAAASTTYSFHCRIIYQAAATTTGIMFGVNGPASPTLVDYTVEIQTAANQGAGALSTTVQPWGHSVAYQTAFTATTGVVAANTNYYAIVEGTVLNGSTAGTIAIQHKSEVAADTSVMAGSWCLYY